MEAKVVNITGNEVRTLELPADIFEAEVNVGLMHQALVRQMANARRGTHKTQGRSEVSRTGAKIYRQKGTGRARHGSRRAPIFVGGGVVHGPKPRDYTKKMPRKMRRAALRSALSLKAANGDLVLLEELHMEAPKTKEMANSVTALVGDSSALLVIPSGDDNIEKSARNLVDIKTLRAHYLNIRDLLGFDKLIIPVESLEVIAEYLSTQQVDEAEE